jgi:threonine/homoserine/homoserine lactone efflux protein
MSFALIPGPDVVCILGNAIGRGARAGAQVCLGIATACLFHVACATLGLAALLLAVPTAFLAVKLAGAAYLCWMGVQMLRAPASIDGLQSSGAAPSRWNAPFVQGALSNLLNPKVALFFVAILPQFIDPARGNPALQALVLGLVSIASGTAVNLVTAALGARARRFLLARQKLFQRAQQAAGGLLIGLGVRVAVQKAA